MSNEVYSIEQIRDKLTPLFIEYDIDKAIIFGSYGKGKATPDSDLDLLVNSKLKGLQFVGLLEDITTTMDKQIDLFDVTHIDEGSEIEKEIQSTGVMLYEK